MTNCFCLLGEFSSVVSVFAFNNVRLSNLPQISPTQMKSPTGKVIWGKGWHLTKTPCTATADREEKGTVNTVGESSGRRREGACGHLPNREQEVMLNWGARGREESAPWDGCSGRNSYMEEGETKQEEKRRRGRRRGRVREKGRNRRTETVREKHTEKAREIGKN